jgi:hypothetical protein
MAISGRLAVAELESHPPKIGFPCRISGHCAPTTRVDGGRTQFSHTLLTSPTPKKIDQANADFLPDVAVWWSSFTAFNQSISALSWDANLGSNAQAA